MFRTRTTPQSPDGQNPGGGGRRTRRATALAVTGGLLAGAGAGAVLAVPALSGASSSPSLTEQVDDGQVDDGQVDDEFAPDADGDRPEIGTRIREVLQPLVDDGTITAEQADAVTAHLVTERLERRPGGGPFQDGPRGPRRGPLPGGEAVAEALGLTVEEVRDALRDGSSIADLADAAGIDIQVVIDAMLGQLSDRLDAAVAEGRLTAEEAAEKLERAAERVGQAVERALPTPPEPLVGD